MNDERIIGIPGDHVVHDDHVYAADVVPNIWSVPKAIFQPIWDMGITGKGVTVSVNDTGVADHHHLPTSRTKRNFTSDRNDDDGNGHGTHCSGTVLGREGVGCAPEAELIYAKVLSNQGSGSTTGINQGRVWAAKEGADIISESLGGPQGNQQDVESINEAYENGCQLIVAAAGNAGYNGSNTIGYPGRYLETYCIGAYREDGKIANFSSGGREIDVATPGEQIISCNYKGGFVAMSGTSMATPHFAGLMALIIHKRRRAGIPDIHGAEAWREFFVEQDFHADAGDPGKDVRFGLGKPLIKNILAWLKEPKWLVWLMVMFCLVGSATAQQTQSTIEQGKATVKTIEVVTYNDIAVAENVLSQTERDVAIVRTDAPNPLVRAYKKTNPFPPTTLNKVSDGRYLLNGASGSRWTIEILSQTENGWWTEYLVATIGDGTEPNPPPIDDEPEQPPSDDWISLTDLYLNSPIAKADRTTAAKLSVAFEGVAKQPFTDLMAMQKAVGKARGDVLEQGFTGNWNQLLLQGDKLINENPPTTPGEYAAILLAIVKGLK